MTRPLRGVRDSCNGRLYDGSRRYEQRGKEDPIEKWSGDQCQLSGMRTRIHNRLIGSSFWANGAEAGKSNKEGLGRIRAQVQRKA